MNLNMNLKMMMISASLVAVLAALPLQAADTVVKDKANDTQTIEKSTSHNPFTGTTTEKVEGRAVRKHKTRHGHAQAEDHVKVERKTKDDGSKTSVTREETHTDDAKARQ